MWYNMHDTGKKTGQAVGPTPSGHLAIKPDKALCGAINSLFAFFGVRGFQGVVYFSI
jgi:hypothetical protein